MASNANLITRHTAALIGNYGKLPVALVRGQGSRLWDADGKEYLDFFAGFGGTVLGHCHPALVEAVTQQANTLWTVGNQFHTEPQIRLAEQLRAKAFPGQAFFCHSGAEAAEAAIKLAKLAGGEKRTKFVSMQRGFHGRTLGALSATPGYQAGFGPLVPGFSHVQFGNIAALDCAVDDQTAGVLIEPIQGEGGIHVPSEEYLKDVRELCTRKGAVLIFDEVWTGVGRTGKYFGHQHFGVTPDIMTMGKALGGGLPVGGILAKPELAKLLVPGTHGCTLGGNPICAAVAARVLEVIEADGLLEHAWAMGKHIAEGVGNFRNSCGKIKEVRGKGLFLGLELGMADGTPVLQQALARGLVINIAQKNVIRLAPALTISRSEVDAGLRILEQAIAAV